jgi:hypothetical protein
LDPETRITLKLAAISILATGVGISLFYSGISPASVAAEVRVLAEQFVEAVKWSLSHNWNGRN